MLISWARTQAALIRDVMNTIRILLTTDNHVGYKENDPIRGDDGWRTFDEILALAASHDIDMIVQGGDLFHVNKPSKKLMYHVMKSLRKHCLGDRPCELELISNPNTLFDSDFNTVNYEDPNINVATPVFAISGNHDDATGDGFLSPLDVLLVTGLINFFGKIPNNEQITVAPLLFQKGSTKLALYGMNNVKDERLHRMFKNGQVKFLRPNLYTDEWFNFMAVHQNHFQHSVTSFLPEHYLPDFLNFVMWGHEHECWKFPTHNPDTGFDTLQPGLSIATSLSEGEMADKHVFILSVTGKKYEIEALPLKSVRPFVMKEVSLQDEGFVPGPGSKDDIVKFLIHNVELLIEEAKNKYLETNPNKEAPLPLVRLRVEYSGDFEVENARRFSNRFVGRIANVNDVIHYYKRKAKPVAQATNSLPVSSEPPKQVTIQEHLREMLELLSMNIVPEDGITDAVTRFIDHDDKQTLGDFIHRTIEASSLLLMDVDVDEQNEEDVKAAFKSALVALRRENLTKPVKAKPLKPKASRKNVSEEIVSDETPEVYSDSDEYVEPTPKPKAKPRARPVAKPRARKARSLLDDIVNLAG